MAAYANIILRGNAETLPWCLLVFTGRTGTDALQSQLDFHPVYFRLSLQGENQAYFHRVLPRFQTYIVFLQIILWTLFQK